MASSVSSERAFSQGGITISKHRNRLKGDIVEALQCVKCMVRHDLLFREPAPSSIIEAEMNSDGEPSLAEPDDSDDGGDGGLGEGSDTAESWEDVLMEDEDDSALTAGMDTGMSDSDFFN